MNCSHCHAVNRDGARFCRACGATLPVACPACGAEVEAGSRFCDRCGTLQALPSAGPSRRVLAESSSDFALDLTSRRPADAERRQLTVLFCDLAESTRLARQLDPEELREVIRLYQATCVKVIERFDGHVAQYLGDGLLVYFGYPRAHEDDAQRAVRTGLGLLAAMETLNRELAGRRGVRLAGRVGIHTGRVVVGEVGGGGRHEHLALGDTPNMAARLQGLADHDTVVISEATSALVKGYFITQDRGTHVLKGVDTPVRVLQVLGESVAQSRLEAAEATGLTPLVGREAEVTLLRECWARSSVGLGQVVLLSGEAGVGKSRLVRALTERVAAEHNPRPTLRCSPYHTNSAFHPVIEHLQRLLRWQRDDPPEARLAALEKAVLAVELPLAEVVPPVAALLSLPLPAHYPLMTMSPQRQKQKTQEALVAWLLAEAAHRPVLSVWEDLHWADPSTLELLEQILERVPTARLLLVLTCRPEFRPAWALRSHVTPLTLTRLSRVQVEEMVQRVTGEKSLPAEVVRQIVAKTDGIPLFVEELVKTILEAGLVREEAGHYVLSGTLPPLAIPATLQDALMARLDRLAPVKDVAQLAAVLGREFMYETLRAVAPLEEETLRQGLEQLVDAELLFQRGTLPQATYVFKHALIRDAAYESLLRSTRQQYHQRIAQVLELQSAEATSIPPELVAHHYTEAGLGAQAIPYWQRAGQRAIERSAHLEAIAHLTKGLEVLATLPDTPERTRSELDFQLTLGPAWMVIKGWSDSEAKRIYTRARELCQLTGETPQLFPTLWGLWIFYAGRGELGTARELGEQLLALAERVHEPMLLLQACHALGPTLFWLGELELAQPRLRHGIAGYDRQLHRASLRYGGHDPGVCCGIYAAWTLWARGYPAQALKQQLEALRLAQDLAHPYTLSSALHFTAWLHQLRREGPAVQSRLEAAMPIVREHEFVQLLAEEKILQGWALAVEGREETGITQMREGLTAWAAMGVELYRAYQLLQLSEVCARVGQPEAGLQVLSEARAAVPHGEGRFYEAELSRLEGELLLALSPDKHSQAEPCFQRALAVARRQQAKSLELRAAMSLSRLWQRQGRRDEARELLTPVYQWFTEGLDTADLGDAAALLGELS